MFGVSPLYASIHLISQSQWFLFQDSAGMPEQANNGHPVAGARSYPGTATFGEGMFQKLWTLVTGCEILESLESSGLNPSIFGSGDNQIIPCNQPKDRSPQDVQACLLRGLYAFSEEAHLKVKLMETSVSSVHMEYGKASFKNGKKLDYLKRTFHPSILNLAACVPLVVRPLQILRPQLLLTVLLLLRY